MKNIYSQLILAILTLLFISTKGNAQWVKTNGPNEKYTDCFALTDTYLFVGSRDGGVYRTANSGESWESVNNGLSSGEVISLCATGHNLFAGIDSQVYLSTDKGGSWKLVRVGTKNSFIFSIVVNDTNLFIGIFSVAPNGEGGGVYRSTNNGTSWSEINTGLTSRRVQALFVKGNKLYAGTHDGLFLSTNNGSSWSVIDSGLTHTDIGAFAVSDTNLYVGTLGGGVFLSTDEGNSWRSINSIFDNLFVSSLITIGQNLFAGTSANGNIYVTTDNGALWNSIGNGLTRSSVVSLISNGEYLFAGTNGAGVWRRPLSEMINTNSVQALPSSNISSTAYPNPFTTSTTISYTLAKRDMVTIEVFDILGRKIQTLANEVMDEGPHSVVFNGENLPLGMYTVKITSGASSEEMKVVLSK